MTTMARPSSSLLPNNTSRRSNGLRSRSSSPVSTSHHRRTRSKKHSTSKESGSLLWTLLVCGLFFTLLDALYVMKYVLDDRHEGQMIEIATPQRIKIPFIFQKDKDDDEDAYDNLSDADPDDETAQIIAAKKDLFADVTTNQSNNRNVPDIEKDEVIPDVETSPERHDSPKHATLHQLSNASEPANVNIRKDKGDLQEKKNKSGTVLKPLLLEEPGKNDSTATDLISSHNSRSADTINTTTATALEVNSSTSSSNLTSQNQSPSYNASTTPLKMSQMDAKTLANLTYDKEPILHLLQEANIVSDLDADMLARLPTWSQVSALYGSQPVFYGLDQCEKFQQSGNASDHFVSTAGTFNTGTNLMAELLIANCHMPERMKVHGPNQRGVRWQVVWGKHTPVGNETFRKGHRTYNESALNADSILPAVMVRDPFKWMQSMCRHEYGAYWRHSARHCPNLVPNHNDTKRFPGLKTKEAVPVQVTYAEFRQHHDSLAGFWNDWYNDYLNATFPRLLVRFEDLIFHPKEVTKTVCECAGGAMDKHKFKYVVDSAKHGNAHGKKGERTSYIDALIKYGTEQGRYKGFEQADLEYARHHLDPNLMKVFNYHYSPEDSQSTTA